MSVPWPGRTPTLATLASTLVALPVLAGGPTAAAPRADSDEAEPPAGSSAPLSPVSVGGGSESVTGVALDRAAVTAQLRPILRGGALGRGRTPAHVIDVASGDVLFAAAGAATVPASTMKLVTATSVLESLGPDQRLRTRTVLVGPARAVPRVVVVGSGDPSLSTTATPIGSPGNRIRPASLTRLARSSARSLEQRGIRRVQVGYDNSLFTGRTLHPSWAASFPALGIVAPVTALQVDQGRASATSRSRVQDPARVAAVAFAALLRESGITVRGTPKAVTAPIASTALGVVASPPVGDLVERTLAASDNNYAEALGRLGALAGGERASFAGVSRRAEDLLRGMGVRVRGARFADASGLSRRNRLEPRTLTDLLRVTAVGYGSLHSGLAVAAGNGSLAARFMGADQRAGRGVVRAKTGTLTKVVGLSGYARRRDGRLLAFAFLDDTATGGTAAARPAVDRAASALVSCDCAVSDVAASSAPGVDTAADP